MNAVILIAGIYTFLDYYFDNSPIKNVKLVTTILTLPSVLIMLYKLLRMKFYFIPYIILNSLNYITMGLQTKIFLKLQLYFIYIKYDFDIYNYHHKYGLVNPFRMYGSVSFYNLFFSDCLEYDQLIKVMDGNFLTISEPYHKKTMLL